MFFHQIVDRIPSESAELPTYLAQFAPMMMESDGAAVINNPGARCHQPETEIDILAAPVAEIGVETAQFRKQRPGYGEIVACEHSSGDFGRRRSFLVAAARI